MLGRVRTLTRLGRWLGPWADNDAAPDVLREQLILPPSAQHAPDDDHRPVEVWRFRPVDCRPKGTWIIAPGLHYQGPADPRFERFARVLAHAGFDVWAPFVPDYIAQRIQPTAHGHFRRTFEAARTAPDSADGNPSVFSISFGSLLALGLAGHPVTASQVEALVVFGGYASWTETARFCMTGLVDGKPASAHDPLNLPVLFLHSIDQLVADDDAAEQLTAAWRRYMERTWGQEAMKHDHRFHAEALAVADHVPEPLRDLFLKGCGVIPGAEELLEPVLQGTSLLHLDAIPHLAGIRCPVHLFHGVDDDVIHHTQLHALTQALPEGPLVRTYLTGMYGHTETDAPTGGLSDAVKEFGIMARMLLTLGSRGVHR